MSYKQSGFAASALLGVIVSAGCGLLQDETGDGDDPLGVAQDGERPLEFTATRLPTLEPVDCAPGPIRRPTLCEWAASFELIVVGRIVGVSALTSPVSITTLGEPDRLGGACPEGEALNIGVQFELDRLEVLSGKAPEGAIRVNVGGETNGMWSPSARRVDGELQFAGEEADKVFAQGTSLGFGLVHDPSEKYLFPGGSNPFTVDGDGKLQSPMTSYCYVEPEELDGGDFREVRAAIAACSGAEPEGEEIRERRRDWIGGYTAVCVRTTEVSSE